MNVEIRLVQKGVLLRVESGETGEEAEESVRQKREFGEIEAFAEFLRVGLDEYGPTTSRFSPKRARIFVEPGDMSVSGRGSTKAALPFRSHLCHRHPMIRCPACARDAPEDSRFCPRCGAPLEDASATPTRTSVPSEVPPRAAAPARHLTTDPTGVTRFLPGTVLAGRYRILGLLGRGGMGEVYRADDLKLGQAVALKFLPASVAKDEVRLQRFLNEVKIARQISHPGVCRVYDVGEVGPSTGSGQVQQFISMEYVDGEDLASLLRRIGRLPRDKAVQIARQLCAGLAAAHDQGVLHRDLKPANVMIDGRGRAKIADFGLAALAGEIGGAEVGAGTPAYMAPEQLAGQEVTVRSDVYALGLILYELFTGKRAFDVATPAEMLRLQSESAPTNPSNYVEGLDPAVERTILRCLERNPADRPRSALEISAALPGGDPLVAALAAGETPSPEIVAAAGGEGALRPWIAAACFAFVLIALLSKPALYQQMSWLSVVPLDLPPEALSVEARRIIRDAGYAERPLDSACGFEYAEGFERHAGEQEPPYSAKYIAEIRPAPIYFWYRQSPRRLTPTDFVSQSGVLRVSEDDPPQAHPGMARVRLDPQGRLLQFDAVPPLAETGQNAGAKPDWTALFQRAGIESSAFEPTQPSRFPFSRYDVREAWRGTFPGQPEVPIRIEAGAFRGRPVSFQVVTPWTPSPEGEPESESAGKERASHVVFLVLEGVLLVCGLLLARRNLRTGRGDRRSAFRTAVCVLALGMLGWVLRADHQFTYSGLTLFLHHVAWNLLGAGCVWVIYIALEPFVRRFWPRAIISWNRLLQGRFRDPMVGRDILVGAAIGLLFNVPFPILKTLLSSEQLGPTTGLTSIEGLVGLRNSMGSLFEEARDGLADAVGILLLLVLLRVILRRPWAAVIVLFLLLSAPTTFTFRLAGWGFWFFRALVVLALVRFGVLGCAAATFFALPSSFVLTLDPTAWYVGRSVLTLLLLAAIAGYGFWISLGGRPLLAERLGQPR